MQSSTSPHGKRNAPDIRGAHLGLRTGVSLQIVRPCAQSHEDFVHGPHDLHRLQPLCFIFKELADIQQSIGLGDLGPMNLVLLLVDPLINDGAESMHPIKVVWVVGLVFDPLDGLGGREESQLGACSMGLRRNISRAVLEGVGLRLRC